MAESNKNKHLTHEERNIIEFGIRSGATQKAIADTIGKQKSTVGKEIKKHRNLRTRVFYCDPQASHQKGSLENNHIELRYILPKGTDLKALGLTNQSKLNLAVSNINSVRKEQLHGKSPIELMKFLEPELFERFYEFGIRKIEGDKVILKPYLLK